LFFRARPARYSGKAAGERRRPAASRVGVVVISPPLGAGLVEAHPKRVLPMPGLGACSHPGATLSATCPGGVVLQCGTGREPFS
jgi:hypothetical protein